MYICILGTLIAAPYNTRFRLVSLHLIYSTRYSDSGLRCCNPCVLNHCGMLLQVCTRLHQAPIGHLRPSASADASTEQWIEASPADVQRLMS